MFQLDLNGILTEIGVAESSALPRNPLRKQIQSSFFCGTSVSPCFWHAEITLLSFMNQCDACFCHLSIWCKYRDLNYSKWGRKCRRTTKNVACVQTPPSPFCTQATKKRLLKRRLLSTTGYPSTTGIFEITCCVILTSNAIIWYLSPRLSWQHEGLSQKKKHWKL